MIIEGHFIDAKQDHGICQVEIKGNKIVKVLKEAAQRADFKFYEEILIPGIVDIHTHLRYGEPHKEDIESGTKAAINGGVVRIMDMPNNPKGFAPVDSESYKRKLEWLAQGHIPVHLYAGIGPDTKPFPEAKYYKVFMAESVGDLFFNDLDTLDSVLENYRGCNVAFHCEDPQVIKSCLDKPVHEERRSPLAEVTSVKNALYLIQKHNLHGMLMHISCKDSVELIKASETKALVEVTPHHLILDSKRVENLPYGKLSKMNPPLRSEDDAAYMRSLLHSEFIHHIGSDHAPHTLEEKLGKEDALRNPKGVTNPSGIPGLDTMGQTAAYLHCSYNVSLTKLNQLLSYNPSKYLGIKHGLLKPGYEASFAALDFEFCCSLDSDSIYTKAGWNAYKGIVMPTIPFVMAQGRIVKEDGELKV